MNSASNTAISCTSHNAPCPKRMSSWVPEHQRETWAWMRKACRWDSNSSVIRGILDANDLKRIANFVSGRFREILLYTGYIWLIWDSHPSWNSIKGISQHKRSVTNILCIKKQMLRFWAVLVLGYGGVSNVKGIFLTTATPCDVYRDHYITNPNNALQY